MLSETGQSTGDFGSDPWGAANPPLGCGAVQLFFSPWPQFLPFAIWWAPHVTGNQLKFSENTDIEKLGPAKMPTFWADWIQMRTCNFSGALLEVSQLTSSDKEDRSL